MSLFRKTLPASLRELTGYMSPAAFQVIPWRGLVGIAKQLARGGDKQIDTTQLRQRLQSHFGDRLKLVDQIPAAANLQMESWPTTRREEFGHLLLELYFTQLTQPEGLFVDLRAQQFGYDGDQYLWQPHFALQLASDFRQGLIDLYKGFYQPNPNLFDQALAALGLLDPNWSESQKADLKELLEAHFGSSTQTKTVFAINDFRQSFHALFQFFKNQEVTIAPDFLTVGCYLVTLYLALDPLAIPLDVNQVVQKTLLGDP
jgi:hypothetical protein